jgi:hypothetical protein
MPKHMIITGLLGRAARRDPGHRYARLGGTFMPSQIVANQEDDVTLELVGVNGAQHPIAIGCATHRPSMVGELVLPHRK